MNTEFTKLIKDTLAEFVCYRDGDLWYKIVRAETGKPNTIKELGFEFPVPISDTGTGIFPAQIKTISLMRWARKHYEKIQNGEWA
jgi:hypothetical protein